MTTIIFQGRTLFPTSGAVVGGKRIVGLFASEDDARAEDADSRAVAIVAWGDLTPEQVLVAEANSDSL